MKRCWSSARPLIAVVAVSLILVGVIGRHNLDTRKPKASPGAKASAEHAASPIQQIQQQKVTQSYAQLPLSFEPNQGQTSQEAQFLAHGPGYEVFLTPQDAVLLMRAPSDPAVLKAHASDRLWAHDFGHAGGTFVRMRLLGAKPGGQLRGIEQLLGKTNYLIGNDRTKWHTNISNYGRVVEHAVYPGIDLVYYGTQRQLEYDFVAAPGSDPGRIQLEMTGAKKLRVDARGDLVGDVNGGVIRLHAPVAYQRSGANNSRKTVQAGYRIENANVVAFNVGAYDAAKELVIDPVLAYSTYLGGTGIDGANAIAVASDDTAFIAGGTFSTDFPTAHALQPNEGGGPDFPQDGFIAKISADGSGLVYSTYLGGSNQDIINGIAVDNLGEAFVTGTTLSSDFPATITSINALCGGDGRCGATWNTLGLIVENGFITKLNIAGSSTVYSGFIGEYEDVHCEAIAVDAADNAYITGQTTSNGVPTVTITPPATPPPPFPITSSAFQPTYGGGTDDAFVAKIVATGNSYAYSSYLGGDDEDIAYGIAVDGASNAYVTGLTYSTNFPTANAAQVTNGGAGDAFFAKVNTDGSGAGSLLYSTYLGGNGLDQGNAVAVDASGNAFVAGATNGGVPFTSPTAYGGESDAFVAKINPAAAGAGSLLFFEYLGGSLGDSGNGIAVDSSGNAYVTGSTVSPNFPAVQAFQSTFGGGDADAFVMKLSNTGAIAYSSYLGGSNTDVGYGIAVDSSGSAYVAGQTCSYDFPVASPVQAGQAGDCDAFVSKISTGSGITITPAGLTFSTTGASSQTESVTVTNGSAPTTISSVVLGGADPQDFAVTNGCGTSLAAGQACLITVTFNPLSTALETASLIITDSAPGSPQIVNLSGNAATLTPDFGLVAVNGTATVTAGHPAQYSILVSSLAGFSSAVTLSCTNLPRNTSCAFSTNPVTPSTNLSTVTATIATTARTNVPPMSRDPRLPFDPRYLALSLMAFAGLLYGAFLQTRRPRVAAVLGLILALGLVTLGVVACGGGQQTGQPAGTPAGTYQIGITGTSGSLTHSAQVTLNVN